MARINVDSQALSDWRFCRLGQLAGIDRFSAFGRCVHVWHFGQTHLRDVLTAAEINGIAEQIDFWDYMVQSDLAERVDGRFGIVRLKGLADRMEWLRKIRASSAAGGQANKNRIKSRLAIPEDSQVAIQTYSQVAIPADSPQDSSLSLALALALKTKTTKNSPSGDGSVSPAVKKQPKPKYHPTTAYVPGSTGRASIGSAFPILEPELDALILELDADHRATNPGGESFLALDRSVRKKLGLLASQKREGWGRWKTGFAKSQPADSHYPTVQEAIGADDPQLLKNLKEAKEHREQRLADWGIEK